MTRYNTIPQGTGWDRFRLYESHLLNESFLGYKRTQKAPCATNRDIAILNLQDASSRSQTEM